MRWALREGASYGGVGQTAFCAGLAGAISHTTGSSLHPIEVRLPATSKVLCPSTQLGLMQVGEEGRGYGVIGRRWRQVSASSCLQSEEKSVAQRLSSADGKKRSFLTVRLNDLLGITSSSFHLDLGTCRVVRT